MIKLPHYTKRDTWIFLTVCIPHVILLNCLLFGTRYVLDFYLFGAASLLTFIIMGISWALHTWVAVTLRNRFSQDKELIRRFLLTIPLFVLMTGITITVLFYGYNRCNFMGYEFDENTYNWALATGILINIFASVIHESVHSFEKWKTILTETEQLKREHTQSQLLGLRSQVSPHFLFNSLNSLSSLITDDPQRAEVFLDEMSKVYRYLLRHNEDKLVTLGTELSFIRSYYYLLQTRYGKGLNLIIEVADDYFEKLLPPLTLQILLDNALKTNLISKEKPLKLSISVKQSGWLDIRNNIQHRISENKITDDSGIINMSNRFRLLCQQAIEITELPGERVLKIPLMNPEQIEAHESI